MHRFLFFLFTCLLFCASVSASASATTLEGMAARKLYCYGLLDGSVYERPDSDADLALDEPFTWSDALSVAEKLSIESDVSIPDDLSAPLSLIHTLFGITVENNSALLVHRDEAFLLLNECLDLDEREIMHEPFPLPVEIRLNASTEDEAWAKMEAALPFEPKIIAIDCPENVRCSLQKQFRENEENVKKRNYDKPFLFTRYLITRPMKALSAQIDGETLRITFP